MSRSDYTEYIARISYGKDSLKMLDVIISRGLPLDRITTTDVWATDTISANLPEMDAFKARMDERIWWKYRMEVEHLCARNKDGSKRTYEQLFYHVPQRRSQTVQVERERRADPRDGGYRERLPDSPQTPDTTTARSSKLCIPHIKGWPLSNGSLTWCQKLKSRVETPRIPGSNLKLVQETQDRPPLSDERPTRRKDRNIVEYLGIAADEPKRFGQLNHKKRAPLAEFGIDEDLCGLYCQYERCLAPTYETSCRDGCWFCHNQGVDQLRNLWKNYPDLWALLMKLDLDSPVTFKADGHTVHDFDQRFCMEEEGLIDIRRPFRWEMLDNPPKFRCMNFEEISLFGGNYGK